MGVETQEGHQSHIDMYDRNPEKKKKKKTPYAHKGRIASSKLFVQNELEETNQPQR